MPRFTRGQIVFVKETGVRVQILSHDNIRNEYLVHILTVPPPLYPTIPMHESLLSDDSHI